MLIIVDRRRSFILEDGLAEQTWKRSSIARFDEAPAFLLFSGYFQNGYGYNDDSRYDPGGIDLQPAHAVIADGEFDTPCHLLLNPRDVQ